MHDFQVNLFGPGLPSAGQLTQLKVGRDSLQVPALKQLIPFTELSAKVGGADHNQLHLVWRHEGCSWLLIPDGLAAQKALLKVLPDNAVSGLSRWKRETLGQHLVWKTVVFLLSALLISALLIIWRYDDVVTWIAGRVPLATEYKLGQSILASLNTQTTLIDKGKAADAVKKIGGRLTKASPYQYQWRISNDPAINAFALPGGIVIVNKGLLEKSGSANELAGVLAHEIQHVEQRHALKNMITSSGIAAAVMLILGDANAVMMIMAHQVSAQYFSRQAEVDADMKGLDLLQKNKIDPKGLSAFFKTMQEAYKNKAQGPEWLSSHPDTGSRIRAVEDYMKGHPCQDCENLTWNKSAILASLAKEPVKN